MFLSSPCLVALLLAATGVEAGSRLWQPPIKHAKAAVAAAITVRDLSGVNNIYSNVTNVSSPQHGHQKRYFGLNTPSDSPDYPHLWPGGNINACYDTATFTHNGETGKTVRDILHTDLLAARELWRLNGLDDKGDTFKFNILPDGDPGCAQALRSTHLLILYAGEGVRKMATSVGMTRPAGAPGPDADTLVLGPTMTLTDILDIGMGNPVANYAHEMGHAWGMHHEHQNPRWWTTPYVDVERSTIFFSDANFKCENLADFDEHMVGYPDPNGPQGYEYKGERNKLCRDHAYASRAKFAGGLNYLPMDSDGMIDGEKSEPDWESIMLYPSTAGGKTVDGVKQNVITKPNGDPIPPNAKPSQQDVKGLKKMYGVKTGSALSMGNLGASSSKFFGRFKSIRKKDPDASCM